jgi:hypothetical protein
MHTYYFLRNIPLRILIYKKQKNSYQPECGSKVRAPAVDHGGARIMTVMQNLPA